MNIDTRKHLKPGPVGHQHPLLFAIRQMTTERTDRTPEDINVLLGRLERRRQSK
jgi:hypothetical protein